jgi:3-hydroxyacyl-CoA dehydrogenase
MTDLVQLTSDNGIAVITINNPPVNALSPGVPEGISEALDQIAQDGSVKAAVLIGGGRTFVAGADIKEFGKMTSGKSRGPGLLPLLLKIEDSTKPVIVAVHGTAFGGGMELAMAGHYRVALATAQFGQPEVKLGLIPGAAGTQRLPRLAGVSKAVELCVSGNPVSAEEAQQLGIVDCIIEGALLSEHCACREASRKPAPKTRERNENLETPRKTLIFPPRVKRSPETAWVPAPVSAINQRSRHENAVRRRLQMSKNHGRLFSEPSITNYFSSVSVKSPKFPDIPK